MNCQYPVAITLNPFKRVGSALDDPSNISLPGQIRRGVEDVFLRHGTVSHTHELTIMVVPAKRIASLAIRLTSCDQPFTEFLPASDTIRTAIRIKIRTEERLHIGNLSNLHNAAPSI